MKRNTNKRYTAGQTVDEGIYLNTRHFTIKSLHERGVLPGEPGDTWRPIPALLVLPLGLILSVLFVIFLPVIGFVMLFAALFRWLRGRPDMITARLLHPDWVTAKKR